MSTNHHRNRLFRMEGRLTELIAVGLFDEGLRMYNSFEGRIVTGELTGATVRGIDLFTIRPDGVGLLDAREVIVAGEHVLTAELTGYALPPAGLQMPPLEVLLEPDFSWPDVPFTIEAGVTYRSSAPRFAELARTAVAHIGSVNMATLELVIEGYPVRAVADREERRAAPVTV